MLRRGRLSTFSGRLSSILAHERFPEAWEISVRNRYDFVTSSLASKDQDVALVILEGFVTFMHARREYMPHKPGATLTELALLALTQGVFRPRTVSSMVARLEDQGKIEKVISESDARIRAIIPTKKLYAKQIEDVEAYTRPLPLLGMGRGAVERIHKDEAFFKRMQYETAILYMNGMNVVRLIPDMEYQNRRLQGLSFSILLQVFNLHAFGKFTPDAPFTVTVSRTADLLGVSRAHARTLFDALVLRGLITRTDSEIGLTQRFIDSSSQSIALTYLLFDEAIGKALEQ